MPPIAQGFLFVLHPLHFPFLIIGVALGIIVGCLPGLTASVGIILLLPFVFHGGFRHLNAVSRDTRFRNSNIGTGSWDSLGNIPKIG